MSLCQALATACVALFVSVSAQAETLATRNGGDTFVAGASMVETLDTPGDTFVAGRSAVVRGMVEGDLHVSGFDVSVSADTAEDLYALGAAVVVRGAIAEDLSAAGFSVRTESTAETKGNARLLGNTVTVEGPVSGALSVTGRNVILNAPIAGDVRILAKALSFGPQAVVMGTITYSVENQMEVPERVASPDRVVFEKSSGTIVWKELTQLHKFREMPMLPTFAMMAFWFVISLLFFIVLGALMLGFMPKRLEKMRKSTAEGPGQTLLLGVIGLTMLFGMVPITGLTIIGLPFVPIALLAIFVAWTLGYALGAYTVAMRIWAGLGGNPKTGNIPRLLVFAGAITAIALLNFIPFVGWVLNYTLVLLGIGAMTNALFQYLVGNPGLALDVDMNPIEN